MEWSRGPIIGRGSSATVSLAANSSSGELFAIKSVDFSDSILLQKENSILSQIDSHPHVVKYLGFDITCENNKVLYNVFLEYVPGGALCNLIKKQGSFLREPMIRFYARQLLLGINYLHSKGIAHCDIKGRNVLVSEDGCAVKIADLGCGKFLENGEPARSAFSGTPAFMAPEVARGEEQGFAADVWAFGCTVIEMATGSAPWPEMNDAVSSLYRIGYSDDAVPEFPRWFSGDGKDFLSKCLNRNSKDRWTVTELLRHPFLQHPNSNFEKVEIFSRNSPTCVIDQGFWESIEASSQSPCMSPILASTVDSPANRIGRLIGSSTLPGWEDEEGWVSVREMSKSINFNNSFKKFNFDMVKTVYLSPIEKMDEIKFQNDNVNHEDEDEAMEVEPFLCEEDLEGLTGGINDDFAEEISFSNRFGTTINVALSQFEDVKDHLVPEIQDFEKNIIEISHLIKI